MPLPAMVGDNDTMMGNPGMQAGFTPPQAKGSQEVSVQDQARGAIETVSKLRSFNKDQMSALATQFPSVSEDANSLMSALDKAIDALVKKIIQTTQAPPEPTPAVVR